MQQELDTEQLLSRIKELEARLEESEQLIDAIKAGEVDAFALNRNNQSEIFTLQSGDFAYRMLVENFREGALNLSEEGLVVYTNNYFAELLGISYDAIIGKSFFQFIHPESIEVFNKLFKKGLAGQSKGEITLCAGTKTIPVYVSLSSLHPTLPTVGMIITDLNEKKQQEKTLEQNNKDLSRTNELLKKSEERYHLMVEEVQDYAILYLNAEGIVENWNSGAEKIKGYRADEIIGKSFLNFYTEEDKKNNLPQKLLRRAAETGRAVQEGWRVRKNGSLFWASVVITAVHNEQREVIGFSKVTHDLTAKKEAADKLKQSASELERYNIELEKKNDQLEERKSFVETLLNSSVDLIMVFDKEYRFLTANKLAEERFSKFYSQPILGRKLTEVIPGIPVHDIELALSGNGHTVPVSKSVVSDKCYEITYVPLHKKGEVYAVMVISHDITEQIAREEVIKENNMELEKMNKELQSFAYISSHDLQEPLRKIQTFATRILEKEVHTLSANGKDHFKRMQQAASRMQTLIEDLLSYSRTNTSERVFQKTDLKEIIDEVKMDLNEDLSEKHATIETSELCEVNIIPFQFRQLMTNLIGNSLKFSNPKRPPRIYIKSKIADGTQLSNHKLAPERTYCHITVTDNGIGFDQQYSEKIFEVFQRLHGKSEYNGTGIGLSIVKKIVENHEGVITAKGELNKGSTFDIYIPVS